MEHKDYYAILGIKQNATREEIKAAYRKMAFRYHPDRNPNNTFADNKLKDINEAYQALSDPLRRTQYDRVSRANGHWKRTPAPGVNQTKDRPPADHSWGESPDSASESGPGDGLGDKIRKGFSVLLNVIFQGIARVIGGEEFEDAAQSNNPPDVSATPPYTPKHPVQEREVTISLTEALQGTKRTVVSVDRRLEVKIPAGARSGTKIKVRRAGPIGADGIRQDVVLSIRVLEDTKIKRKGDDIYMDTNVNLYTAILGGEVSVSCLKRKFLLNVPAGTQPDQVFRLKGKGMPKLNSPHEFGDLYVQVKISLPVKLSDHEKALFEMLAQSV